MTVELPDGPVTIMFTDIEGSTALRTTLGDRTRERALSRSRRAHPRADRRAPRSNAQHDERRRYVHGAQQLLTYRTAFATRLRRRRVGQ